MSDGNTMRIELDKVGPLLIRHVHWLTMMATQQNHTSWMATRNQRRFLDHGVYTMAESRQNPMIRSVGHGVVAWV